MIEHKKRFSKKPATAAPAQSAPAEPAKPVKAAKAEPAKKTVAPAPKPVEAPKPVAAPKVAAKPAAKPAAAPKVEAKPAPKAAPKAAGKPVAAPKPAAKPAAAPKVEAKPAEPKVKATPKLAAKVDKIKNDIKSMPEQTLEFFANLLLWISIAVCILIVLFGIVAAIAVKDANAPIIAAGAIIVAIVAMIYPLIIWSIIRVFVNISKTLMKIDAKIPAPKEEEK